MSHAHSLSIRIRRGLALPLALGAMLSAGLLADAAQAYVRVANCDKVTHDVHLNLAGEMKDITLKPGESYHTYAWPVRISMGGKRPEGYITTHQVRNLDEYCIWDGELKFQRRRTALFR